MPDADPARRRPPTTWELRRHRAATPVARVVLRLRRRPPARAAPKVTILLVHAWGKGGTTRTMLNVAEYLSHRHEVEIISLWRMREEPVFEHPPGVRVTALDDLRPSARRGPWNDCSRAPQHARERRRPLVERVQPAQTTSASCGSCDGSAGSRSRPAPRSTCLPRCSTRRA